MGLYHNATATSEPIINQNSEKRGDIRIIAGDKQIILDVMVTCPAAPSMVNRHNSHLIPGVAAVHGVKKNEKYLPDLPPNTEFVPFVIETGGRLAKTTYKWLDSFWKDVTEERTRKLRQAAVRSLCVDVQRQLFMSNANMLYKFAHHLIEMRTEH